MIVDHCSMLILAQKYEVYCIRVGRKKWATFAIPLQKVLL